MKTLFILRHAKSSWKDESLQDFDRPLNGRGRKAAELIGTLMKKQKLVPDLVLSSPAIRARETIEILMKAAKLAVELRYDQRIYEASPLQLLEVISQIEEDKKSALLVGHNPGLEDLLHVLTGQAQHMSTACLAKIDLKANKWSKELAEKGSLDWIVKAKELEQDSVS